MTITGVLDIVPVVDGEDGPPGDDAVVYSLEPSISSFNLDAARTKEQSCTVALKKSIGGGVPVAQNSGNLVVRGYNSAGSIVNSSVSTSTNGSITFLSSAGNNLCVLFKVYYVADGSAVTYITIPVILSGKRNRFCGYWDANTNYYDNDEVNDNVVLVLDNGTEQAYERKGGGTVSGSSYKPNTTLGATKWKSVETNPKTYFKTVLATLIAAKEGDFDRLFAKYCCFQEVTVTGVINNLITIIDYANNINRDLITSRVENGETKYYIDVLRCGDYVWIKSLPAYAYNNYQLPYYVDSGNYTRGWTKFITGVEHQMSADEMRQLVGRKITFKIDNDLNEYQTTIGSAFHFQPYPTNSIETQVRHVSNGQRYFYVPVSNNVANLFDYRRGAHIIPQIFHVECVSAIFSKHPTEPDFHSYGYVWLCEANTPTTHLNEGIDDHWVDE